jgi:predicted nucleotidyltransferase component of viral defense system
MTKIVKDIYNDTQLAALLGFKGGTAMYFFHQLPRFSVDLDFDLLDESQAKLVIDKINNIAQKYGQIIEQRNKYFTLFWLLSYQKGVNQIKIEISKRSSGNQYEVKNYLGFPALVMTKEDMFANKLAALLGRKSLANRDIFDLWYMLDQNWDFNKTLLEKRTKTKPKKYLKTCLKLLRKHPPAHILEGIGDLLTPKMKAWAKQNLINDTIFLLKARYEN